MEASVCQRHRRLGGPTSRGNLSGGPANKPIRLMKRIRRGNPQLHRVIVRTAIRDGPKPSRSSLLARVSHRWRRAILLEALIGVCFAISIVGPAPNKHPDGAARIGKQNYCLVQLESGSPLVVTLVAV